MLRFEILLFQICRLYSGHGDDWVGDREMHWVHYGGHYSGAYRKIRCLFVGSEHHLFCVVLPYERIPVFLFTGKSVCV